MHLNVLLHDQALISNCPRELDSGFRTNNCFVFNIPIVFPVFWPEVKLRTTDELIDITANLQ